MNIQRKNGFTLVEMAIALGVFAFLIVTTGLILSNNFKMQMRNNYYSKLTQVMKENHYEIESRKLSELPATGQCYYREYDMEGHLTNEGESTAGSSACSTDNITESSIKVVVEIKNLLFSDFTYSHPNFLKKPADPEAIKEIVIKGRTLQSKDAINKIFFLTVFKR